MKETLCKFKPRLQRVWGHLCCHLPPSKCSSQFNQKPFMSHCDPHANHKYLPAGPWPGVLELPWHQRALGQAHATVPFQAPLHRDALSKFSSVVAVCNSHPHGTVLLTSSPAGAQSEEAGSLPSRDRSLAGATTEQPWVKHGPSQARPRPPRLRRWGDFIFPVSSRRFP